MFENYNFTFEGWLKKNGADGMKPIKLNRFDRFVNKEHAGHQWNRMSIFGIWTFTGASLLVFIPLITIFIWLQGVPAPSYQYVCLYLLSILPGAIAQIFYSHSCDKIDYNSLIEENAQLNMFRDLDL